MSCLNIFSIISNQNLLILSLIQGHCWCIVDYKKNVGIRSLCTCIIWNRIGPWRAEKICGACDQRIMYKMIIFKEKREREQHAKMKHVIIQKKNYPQLWVYASLDFWRIFFKVNYQNELSIRYFMTITEFKILNCYSLIWRNFNFHWKFLFLYNKIKKGLFFCGYIIRSENC
jgi:hypothetical protein